MARLILDTGVLIAGVRGRLDLGALADADDVAIPAIAVAEYLAGVFLDPPSDRASAQRAFLADVLAVVPVKGYDIDIAEQHAWLLAHTHRTGTRRGTRDLIVAATARATDRIVLTTDERARFADLPEVRVRLASRT